MRKIAILAATAASLTFTTSAFAADVYAGSSMKDLPVVEAAPSWSGLYIGAGIGAASVNHEIDGSLDLCRRGGGIDLAAIEGEGGGRECVEVLGANLDGIGGDGIFGTLQVGYDRQVGSRFLIGAFFDYDFSDVESTLDIDFLGQNVLSASLEQEYMWTAGGRIGVLVNDDTLLYALAGYTEAKFDFSGLDGLNIDEVSGITVGGGLETRLRDNWFLKVEYRYTELDAEKIFEFDERFVQADVEMETTIHSARAVLTYKFDLFGHHAESPLK